MEPAYRTDLGLSGSNLTALAPGGAGKGYLASLLPFRPFLIWHGAQVNS